MLISIAVNMLFGVSECIYVNSAIRFYWLRWTGLQSLMMTLPSSILPLEYS